MKKYLLSLTIAGCLSASAQNRIELHPEKAKDTISRHIYGHFAEHLGRCIYGGFWVGEDSPIPNTRGVRNDVIAALMNGKNCASPPVMMISCCMLFLLRAAAHQPTIEY